MVQYIMFHPEPFEPSALTLKKCRHPGILPAIGPDEKCRENVCGL
jgi:hypothetical protein